MVIYQLSRLAFLLANAGYFTGSDTADVFKAFFTGTRFDLNIILVLNAPFVLFHLIPAKAFYTRIWQNILRWYFFIVNIPVLMLNCIDLEYFKYQGKRTTADLFGLFSMGDDMQNTLPQMARDFWYVLVVFALLAALTIFLYNRIKFPATETQTQIGFQWLLLLPVSALVVIGARGGLQLKPLGILSAAGNTPPTLVPLVLNTPFTVFKTLGKDLLEEKKYFTGEAALQYFTKDHQYTGRPPFQPKNVVIIILESFSSEFIGTLNNGKGYTPFLDSLAGEGMLFTNAYANAKKSIDGIPSVLAALPTLMPASYITSPYNGNKLHSIAAVLKPKGYTSAFFHGGNNGTMGFDNFTSMSGFGNYYGRKEYPGNDYDGHWGIFDENFYHFYISKMNEMKPPFVTSFFSLSSHHPYTIPVHLKNRFPKGPLPIHESIGYADYALASFFREASKTKWFDNTLFVITSDHTGPSAIPFYQTKTGMFRVPILYFMPGSELKGRNSRTTQQTDIVPGILDLLNYDLPFTAFGNSPFDTTSSGMAVNYPGDVYQAINDRQLLQFDGSSVIGVYDVVNDSLLKKNLVEKPGSIDSVLLSGLKSVLQQYESALAKNKLIPEQLSK